MLRTRPARRHLDALVDSFVSRAEASGCEAIVVTLDTHVPGWRTHDLDLTMVLAGVSATGQVGRHNLAL